MISKAGLARGQARGDTLSRRKFGKILGAGVLTVLSSTHRTFSQASPPVKGASTANDLTFRSATELARMIRAKEITSEELVHAHLSRIALVNPQLNAVFQVDGDRVLRDAKAADKAIAEGRSLGRLHGVPVTIKDSFDTAGIISTAGTQGRAQHIPERDATVVARLRKAGAIILGKTNTPELTLSYETDNLVYGRTRNPYDLGRTPGGSSGGAAAIIAAGGSALDVGSDTAGSLRVPAHFCGIASLKPTYGRVSRAGHIIPPGGVVGRCTHVGPLARYIEDLVLLLPILSGPDSKDPDVVPASFEDPKSVNVKTLKLAWYADRDNAPISADIIRVIRSTVKRFNENGATAQEQPPPAFDEAREIVNVINTGDSGEYYKNLLRECGTRNPAPETAAFLEIARTGGVSGRKYSDVLLDWARFRETAMDFMSAYDLFVGPVCSGTAPEHGGARLMNFSDSQYFNLLGWPAAVVRAGADAKGLPIGVQIVGRPWMDHQVLAAALHIEKTLRGYKPDFAENALTGR